MKRELIISQKVSIYILIIGKDNTLWFLNVKAFILSSEENEGILLSASLYKFSILAYKITFL